MKDRAILHSDANSFYASVEIVLNPKLRGKAVAVCGSTDERHGIVLAKSEQAKKYGIKTGMANWQALQCCKDLIIVHPQYDYYLKFSKLLHGIYRRYTDRVEPFGMDECWLDITASAREPMEIAEEIRQTVEDELGLTVSIGVSFNKIFAKLGSDMKKPNAITEINRENFKEKVWCLPCSELLYCGSATTAKLQRWMIRTIGDLAKQDGERMRSRLGKNGYDLWRFANGLDDSRVAHQDYCAPAKSIGHGITCVSDIETPEEAYKVIVALSQDIGYRLRAMNLKAKGIHLFAKDTNLFYYGWQAKIEVPTQDEMYIAEVAFKILKDNYVWHRYIRALTISAINLENADNTEQTIMFFDYDKQDKRKAINLAMDTIRERYGKGVVKPCVILDEDKIPKTNHDDVIMPSYMFR